VQKTIKKGTAEKPHKSITEEGTVKKPHLEICASQGNSVAMHSSDLCDGGSSGVTGVQGVLIMSWSYRSHTETLL